MIVVDTNVIVYMALPGANSAAAARTRERDSNWVAPVLWRSELRNALVTHMRQGNLSMESAVEAAAEAELWVAKTYHVESNDVLRLAVESRRSAYDCEYVALARELGVRLVTADRALVSAFPDTCIALDAFAA